MRGDELRLKQMMLNILNASARQLGAGDAIRIGSSVKGQELALLFTYRSAPPPDAPRIHSIGLPVARSKHGLELALARLLVAMHQGTLEMKTTPDRTTTITLKFPALRIV